ncbi:methyl-accepting chemotaxis protein [Pararhodospirillum oryzae]|uniref:Methyl-accepting chemotaxis protein n=1 Tax=Pararhodospirillum oryzae TaxID=478448 RepID=A0A512H4U8_9PROT|nr:methyl-accepting chemotaxis protein [Pararhodospirillum oryzae]GEO80486.1 hypothetical protein ROR02_06170 [Pararhodospirillum oryzae]
MKFRSVKWPIVLAASALALLFMAMLGAGLLSVVWHDQVDNLTTRARQMGTMTAEMVSAPLWNMDQGEVERLLGLLKDDPDFHDAEIRDKGQVLARLDQGEALKEAPDVVRLDVPIHGPQGKTQIGLLAIGFSTERAWAQTERMAGIGGLLTLGLAVVLAGVVWLVMSRIVRPLADLTGVMDRLTHDDLDGTIPHGARLDELGKVAHVLAAFQQTARDRRALEAERQALRDQEAQARRGHLEALAAHLDEAVGAIVTALDGMATDLDGAAARMGTASDHTADLTRTISQASEESSSSSQTVAVAVEELTASIHEISRQVTQAVETTSQAVAHSANTQDALRALESSVSRIGEITKLIDDIASQTNLLALNATIEAARAGEAGKGFAVVASEVKNLASQTIRATEEIGRSIVEVGQVSETVVSSTTHITRSVEAINQMTSGIASAVEEQSVTTRDISANVSRVAEGATEVSRTIAAANTEADAVRLAARDVMSLAHRVKSSAATLRTTVEKVLSDLRAG